MRRIDLTSYTVEVPSNPEPIEVDVKQQIEDVLNAGNFTPTKLLERADLIKKIKIQDATELILEDADWAKMVVAFNGITGFSIVHEEMVRRVLQAPEFQPKVLQLVPKGDQKQLEGIDNTQVHE